MAETKTATKKRKATGKGKSSPSRSKAKTSATASSKKGRPAKAKRPASKAGKAKSAPRKAKAAARRAVPSKPQAVLDTVEETAKDAGGKVAGVASKAKVPLLAGGAALAGAAGGLALGARQAHHKSRLGKVSSKDLTNAAKKVGEVGAQVGEVALEVRRARESTNGNGKVHRSPIEVVLQGLTSRRPRG
jgi:hypothetical protein